MIKSLLAYEWRAMVRQPAPLFLSICVPFLLIGLVGVMALQYIEQGDLTVQAAIVDEDQTFETKTLTNQLQQEQTFKQAIHLIPMSLTEAKHAISHNEIAGIVRIPSGFTNELRHGHNTPIQVTTNQHKTLEAGMIKMLLDSGAQYISAAQSGVNTVYDLYLKNIEDRSKRSNLYNQMVVTFTFYALSRNNLFDQTTLEAGSTIGWTNHFMLLYFILGTIVAVGFFQFLNNQRKQVYIQERLRTYHILQPQIKFKNFLSVSMFTWIVGLLFSALAAMFYLPKFWLDWRTQITILLVAFLLGAIAVLFELLTKSRGLRSLLFIIVMLTELFFSGVFLPQVYLASFIRQIINFQPLYPVYQAFETIIVHSNVPFISWIWIGSWIMAFHMIIFILARKEEGKYAYIPFSTHK